MPRGLQRVQFSDPTRSFTNHCKSVFKYRPLKPLWYEERPREQLKNTIIEKDKCSDRDIY